MYWKLSVTNKVIKMAKGILSDEEWRKDEEDFVNLPMIWDGSETKGREDIYISNK